MEIINQLTPGPLNCDVKVGYNPYGQQVIAVGNSGLYITVIQGNWNFNFTPEGNSHPVDQKRTQYALTFFFALNQFMKWWSDENNFQTGKLKRQNVASCETNPTMISFMERNLQKSLRKVTRTKVELNFDILSRDPQTMQILEEKSIECEDNHFYLELHDTEEWREFFRPT